MRDDVQQRAVAAPPPSGKPTHGKGVPISTNLPRVLSASDELINCRDRASLWRRTTELARGHLGLERVGLFVREPGSERVLMRGTWGTGLRGETTDEQTLAHELTPRDCNSLLSARQAGLPGLYLPDVPWFASQGGRSVVIGSGWVVATPLVAGRDVIGVMYNDAALTRGRVDDGQQVAAAVLCTLLALLHVSRRRVASVQPLPLRSAQNLLVQRVLSALQENLMTTGEQLASGLGVSPGHLARSFKREMGLSLVDYRNRLRIERFFETVQRGDGNVNLLTAALEAGFGSYAQFHRVHRKFVGATPRDVLEHRHAAGGPIWKRAGLQWSEKEEPPISA
jgi:AraC-like DNA-binding protein